MPSPTITLKEYLEKAGKDGKFVIPNYQRGYIWGKINHLDKKKEDSASFMLKSLVTAFENKKAKGLFIQGITVHVQPDRHTITLIDGQKRTTFFYLLLKWLNAPLHFVIDYSGIREESNKFLKDLDAIECSKNPVCEEEKYQDIYFFKKTLHMFHLCLGKKDEQWRKDFLDYLLNKVRFLYIEIKEEKKAITVFTMMNGNKAEMKGEELIKAELLRCSSLETDQIGPAENASIRGRLAREWDQWLYWWNKPEIQKFFHIDTQLGWLLPLFVNKENVSFDEFRKKKMNTSSVKQAKLIIKELRLLQKSIEDAYAAPLSYNYIGAILNIRNSKENRFRFLKWYFDLKDKEDASTCAEELQRYFDWAVLDMNHEDIINKKYESFKEAKSAFREKLSDNFLYNNAYETGARWLLRCNVIQDCNQGSDGRKFDFSIWIERSLEHIYPKSKVGYLSGNGKLVSQDGKKKYKDKSALGLWREDIFFEEDGNKYYTTEHSIGNLVLLYKNDNSKFKDADFQTKKNIFFEIEDTQIFKSRHLIHTISVFAHSEWNGQQIARNQKATIDAFDEYYKKYNEDTQQQ